MNAVTAAITGALGGQTNLQVAANTLAPYAAQTIGENFGHGDNKNTAAQMASHAILGATLAYINGGDPTAGGTAAVASEAAANYLTQQYKDDKRYQNAQGEFMPNLLPESEKSKIRTLTSAIGAVAGGTVGSSAFNAQLSGVVGQNAVENNILSEEQYKRKVELIKKAQGGENGVSNKFLALFNEGALTAKEAEEFLTLVAVDKRSNDLLKAYVKNPNALNLEQKQELANYINQASDNDPARANRIYSNAALNIGTADPFTGEQFKKTVTKAQQSLSYENSYDKKLAEAGQDALLGAPGKLATGLRYVSALAGSYNIGEGSAKIVDGQYKDGIVQVVNGALLISPTVIATKIPTTKQTEATSTVTTSTTSLPTMSVPTVGSKYTVDSTTKLIAEKMIKNSTPKALNKDAAVAIAGDATTSAQTKAFTNSSLTFDGKNKDKSMKTYKQLKSERVIEAIDDQSYKINDTKKYMDYLKTAYHFSDNPMNNFTEKQILNYIANQKALKIFDGLPGAHAEVQAQNSLYNISPYSKEKNVNIATYKLGKSNSSDKQGGSFTACTNCSGILSTESNIPTGRK